MLNTVKVKMIVHLKSIYGRLFPLESFRRFVADQLLDSLYFLGYYGTLTVVAAVIISTPFYFLGSIAERYLGPLLQNRDYYIVSGIIAGVIISIPLVAVVTVISLAFIEVYRYDYSPWVKYQEEQLANSSLWKYLLLRLVYTLIAISALVVYYIVSVRSFKFIFGTPQGCSFETRKLNPCVKEDFPDFAICLLSCLLQLVIGAITFGLYQHFNESCRNAYRKHVQRAETALSKCEDELPSEIAITFK